MPVENSVMAFRFEIVAIDSVGKFLRRVILEMNGLSRIGTHARGYEHQPGQ